MNRIQLIGRITRDLELRSTATGKYVTEFTLAIRRDENKTDFIPCTVWNNYASTLCKYCQKGDMIAVEGRLESNNYETKDGEKRTKYSVLVDKLEFLVLKKVKQQEKTEEESDMFEDNLNDMVLEDDDLPF